MNEGFAIRNSKLLIVILLLEVPLLISARAGRYRCTWRQDPATSMVIGWDQLSGNNPVLYYDTQSHGRNAIAYARSVRPDRIIPARGMTNHFVRLRGLEPNTVYHFVIRDSEGVSAPLSFRTAPADPGARLSVIAGGDSRNNRPARREANRLVSKLRPDFVVFAGDMTAGDTGSEWQAWLDDWQLTIGSDGRIFPIVVARGNHERDNRSLLEIFDLPNKDLYYALSFGGNLLRVYTLNSEIPSSGDQRVWLERDLEQHKNVIWKFAQYHRPMRPHTRGKVELDQLVRDWAPLFYRHRVRLVLESDGHVVKWTYPIRPSNGAGNEGGFVRDDRSGAVYIGEGCWGAPLRENNDDKSWTRNSGSFNQFKWIFVDRRSMEVRTVRVGGGDRVGEVAESNRFTPPVGLSIWSPSNGDVVELYNPAAQPQIAGRSEIQVTGFSALALSAGIALNWSARHEHPDMYYELQRSTNGGRQYETIASRQAEGAPVNSYRYLDKAGASSTNGKWRYRLKCVAPDGSLQYFECSVDAARKPLAPPQKIMPDPRSGKLTFRYELSRPSEVKVALLDDSNEALMLETYPRKSANAHLVELDLNKIPAGEYLLIVKAGASVVKRYQVIKR